MYQLMQLAERFSRTASAETGHRYTWSSGMGRRERLDGSCTTPAPVLDARPNKAPVIAATEVGDLNASAVPENRRVMLPACMRSNRSTPVKIGYSRLDRIGRAAGHAGAGSQNSPHVCK